MKLANKAKAATKTAAQTVANHAKTAHANLQEKHIKYVHHYHRHLVILGCLFLCVSAIHVWYQTGEAVPNCLAIFGTLAVTVADF